MNKITIEMHIVNFPVESNSFCFMPVLVEKRTIFPESVHEAMYFESGENTTVHAFTGLASIL